MKFIFAFLLLVLPGMVNAQALKSLPYEGNEKASIQMYLFSSYLCPHCADFHKNILPKIRKKYLKKDAVLYFVDIANNQKTILPAVLMRCFDAKKTAQLSDTFYEKQDEWSSETNPRQKLFELAKAFHITPKDFDKCVDDRALMEQVVEQQRNLSDLYGITKIPTLVIRRGNSVQQIEGADEETLDAVDEFME